MAYHKYSLSEDVERYLKSKCIDFHADINEDIIRFQLNEDIGNRLSEL
jgi:hypothetical protein